MKIKVSQITELWQGINAIYKANDLLPGAFDYHMIKRNVPILQKEVQNIQEAGEEKFQEIKDTEVDLPLSKIRPDMLPNNMPKGALNMIDPLIIHQKQPEHQSAIASLLDGQDNGKESEEAKSE